MGGGGGGGAIVGGVGREVARGGSTGIVGGVEGGGLGSRHTSPECVGDAEEKWL